MLSVNNYVFTEKGILSISNLLELQEDGLPLPKVLSLDTNSESDTYLQYLFETIDEISEEEDKDIYEIRFVDVYSSRNVIINCTNDSEILQYNALDTEDDPIINKNFQVLKYLNSNLTRTKLLIRWELISDLFNYANKSPNISLGDTVVKFSNKYFRFKEPAYNILCSALKIPVFASISKSSYWNFILIK